MLVHPQFDRPFYLQTDCSGVALGGELFQYNNSGNRAVLAFISRSLRGAELNYTTTEKELLAIVVCLKKLRTYLLGAKVIIRTDHQALKLFKQCRLLSERLTRCALFIQEFDYDIEYVRGKENTVADVLSRYPSDEGINLHEHTGLLLKIDNLKNLQANDPALSKVLARALPNYQWLRRAGDVYYQMRDNILCHVGRNGERVAIPQSMVEPLVWHTHEVLGHFGPQKIFCYLRRLVH